MNIQKILIKELIDYIISCCHYDCCIKTNRDKSHKIESITFNFDENEKLDFDIIKYLQNMQYFYVLKPYRLIVVIDY